MSTIDKLDPYTAQAPNDTMTPQEKIAGLREIINATQTAMLTTRSADGQMHSRAMNPVSPDSETQLTLTFIANNVCHKFEEIQNDSHVNVSFLDPSTTNWASFSGQAKIIDNRDEIKRHWSSATSAWFGDLEDDVHKGDSNDPRVSLIQVVPNEIRFWKANKGKSGSPGELRTITQEDIALTQSK